MADLGHWLWGDYRVLGESPSAEPPGPEDDVDDM
jgi:hypothetical protein